MSSSTPIGVLGGTFDPVHCAHLRLAEELADGIGLSKVRFIPTGAPPHRGTPKVTGAHRMEMVRLAIAGNPRFEADDREIRRQGVCYTFDTLNELRAELGDRPLCLLMGSDAFSALTTWHRWEELFDLAHIVIAHRPGFSPQQLQSSLPGPLRKIYLQRLAASTGILRRDSAGTVYAREITALDIAATQIRGLLAGGGSARYLVPDAVLDYIETNRLYKERDAR
ncbi:MAG: nicotinate-nucleotide adenylyltransferase [Betaproteobacteria bacterium]|nr:nicotinate-nucleotide adenylyltransferase [Betaproteobacteria bacterium]